MTSARATIEPCTGSARRGGRAWLEARTGRRSASRLLIALALVTAPALAAAADTPVLPTAVFKATGKTCKAGPHVGTPLKHFRLPNARGGTLDSNSLKGQVTLLNVWGTWCKPCLEELPEFAKLHRAYRDHGAQLVALATDDKPEPVVEFARSRKLAGTIAYGAEDYAGSYKPERFPFTFVVDRAGTIVASFSGYERECLPAVETALRAALTSPAAPAPAK